MASAAGVPSGESERGEAEGPRIVCGPRPRKLRLLARDRRRGRICHHRDGHASPGRGAGCRFFGRRPPSGRGPHGSGPGCAKRPRTITVRRGHSAGRCRGEDTRMPWNRSRDAPGFHRAAGGLESGTPARRARRAPEGGGRRKVDGGARRPLPVTRSPIARPSDAPARRGPQDPAARGGRRDCPEPGAAAPRDPSLRSSRPCAPRLRPGPPPRAHAATAGDSKAVCGRTLPPGGNDLGAFRFRAA